MFTKLILYLKEKPFFFDILNKSCLEQFKKYLITGFTSFSIEYSLFLILLDVLKINYLVSNIIVYTLAFWFIFLVNKFWSFKSKSNIYKQFFLYLILFTFNLLVSNILIFYYLTEKILIPAKISKILVMGSVVSWNFILYKKIIYK